MVAAVAAALVSGSSEMVQPESAPARMLVARIAFMRRCHLLCCAMVCPLLAVGMGRYCGKAVGRVYSGFVQS